MSTTTARLLMRYRPGADVLSGELDVRELAVAEPVVERLDGDTVLEFAMGLDGVEYLVSFQLVHASARLELGHIPLPPALEPSIRALVTTSQGALVGVDDPLVRTRARGNANAIVARSALARDQCPTSIAPTDVADRASAQMLSRALLNLAEVVQQQESPGADLEAINTDHLSRLLRELSSTINAGKRGRTAAGTSAAVRVALRRPLPLADDQVDRLDAAMLDLQNPSMWQQSGEVIAETVVALTTSRLG